MHVSGWCISASSRAGRYRVLGMGEPFIVSIHVPKTAGTSLAQVFDRCFQRRIMYDYQGYREPQVVTPEVRQNTGFIRSYFDVLHGHFAAAKYLDVFPDAAFIATLRHPVSRVISHYIHELNENSPAAFYHDDLASGRMDIVEFAEQDGVGNAMASHLLGRELRDYAGLIISEHFQQSCYILSRTVRPLDLNAHFGVPAQFPMLNQAISRPCRPEIDQRTREAIFSCTGEDNEIYVRAIGLLKGRAVRYL